MLYLLLKLEWNILEVCSVKYNTLAKERRFTMGVIGPIIFFIICAISAFIKDGDDSGVKFIGGVIAFFVTLYLLSFILT